VNSHKGIILVPLDHSTVKWHKGEIATAVLTAYLYRDDEEKKPIQTRFVKSLVDEGLRDQWLNIGSSCHLLYGLDPREKITPQFIARVRADFHAAKFGR